MGEHEGERDRGRQRVDEEGVEAVQDRQDDDGGDGARGDRWLNLVTNVPASELGAAALADLYAMRWDLIPISE